ncbi:hypothetical protein RND81_04G041500 [Saponaria officinalis]|uniref:Uncharacterized protein n=1 Tax=Saponaria officinalis TaxID=3572 RepID=A0AAW1LCY6_SAPOF
MMLKMRSPTILKCKAESNLEPKLKFLNEYGFVGNILTEVIVKNPLILRRSLNDHLIPNTEYLKGLMNNDQAAVLFVVKRATWLMTCDLKKVLQPNIDLLLKEGVGMISVLKLFMSQPRSFICPVERMSYGIETVKKFGTKPTDNMFIHALRVVLSMNESNLKKKLEIFRDLGWTDEDLAITMARQPLCFSQSEDKIRSSFELFVKTMKLRPEDVINHPKLLMYSLSKRSIPRCKVIMALKEKELMKDMHIPSLINMPGDDFTRKFILKHPTLSSSLWSLYLGNQKVDDIAVQ